MIEKEYGSVCSERVVWSHASLFFLFAHAFSAFVITTTLVNSFFYYKYIKPKNQNIVKCEAREWWVTFYLFFMKILILQNINI